LKARVGELRIENGKWRMENGKWRMESGSGKWKWKVSLHKAWKTKVFCEATRRLKH